jgi:hypothetical protein
VAAAAALVVGFPLSPVLLNEQSPTTSVSIPETIGDTRITHSGKNYGPEVGAASQQSARGVEAAPDLTRLNDPAALARCLEAVQHLTGSAPLSADFGSVRSSPALVVTFPGGSRVAVGASCDLGRPDVLTRLVDTP